MYYKCNNDKPSESPYFCSLYDFNYDPFSCSENYE